MVFANLFYTHLASLHLRVTKYTNNLESNFLKRWVNKAFLSHTSFYLEDDDHITVDFNGETISFTCQLIKILKK